MKIHDIDVMLLALQFTMLTRGWILGTATELRVVRSRTDELDFDVVMYDREDLALRK